MHRDNAFLIPLLPAEVKIMAPVINGNIYYIAISPTVVRINICEMWKHVVNMKTSLKLINHEIILWKHVKVVQTITQ